MKSPRQDSSCRSFLIYWSGSRIVRCQALVLC
ncbi:MAG: hypothetical protein CMQ27_08980 [Gammaproteobacteria bacterium]|nr:hypothetical protein [Gammaproteobacteria bacterium]